MKKSKAVSAALMMVAGAVWGYIGFREMDEHLAAGFGMLADGLVVWVIELRRFSKLLGA